MKKLVTFILVISMVLAMLTGCTSTVTTPSTTTETTEATTQTTDESTTTEPPAEKQLKIVWINPLQNYIGYVNQEEYTKKAAADYGIELICLGVPTADGIVEKNAELLENAVAMKPDAIICVPFNNAMYPALEKAKEAGIVVIGTGSDTTDTSLRTAYIGTDNKTMGIMAADTFNTKFNGNANVFIMMSQLDASNQVEAKNAFEAAIKNYPGIQVVGFDKDNADMAQAMEKFDGILRADKTIDTIWMLEGVGGAAAVKIAAEQSRMVNILEVDDGAEKIDNIKNGSVFGTLAQNFAKMGYESVRLAYEILTGVENVPTILDSGIIVITKDNVETYAKDMEDAISLKDMPWKQ